MNKDFFSAPRNSNGFYGINELFFVVNVNNRISIGVRFFLLTKSQCDEIFLR